MIEGTIIRETALAFLFLPKPFADTRPGETWLPRSTVDYMQRSGAELPAKASVRIAKWKIAELKWQNLDDE